MSAKQRFEGFVLKNMDSAYRFAYSYAKNKEDAEDIISESLLRAWKAIDSLRDERNMKAWFFKIISNTAVTYLKKKGAYIAMDDNDLERLEYKEDKYNDYSFESMIKNLPEKYKEVIVLRFFEDMSLAQIAEILSLNENTVKTRLYRALKILKVDIEQEVRWIS